MAANITETLIFKFCYISNAFFAYSHYQDALIQADTDNVCRRVHSSSFSFAFYMVLLSYPTSIYRA